MSNNQLYLIKLYQCLNWFRTLALCVSAIMLVGICTEVKANTPFPLLAGIVVRDYMSIHYNSYLTIRDNYTLPSLGILPSIASINQNYLWNEVGIRYSYERPRRMWYGISLSYRTATTEIVQHGNFSVLFPTSDSGGYTRTTRIHQSAITIVPHIDWNMYKGIRLKVTAGLSIAIPSNVQENISSDSVLPTSQELTYSVDSKSASTSYTDKNNKLMNCIIGVGFEKIFSIYRYSGSRSIELVPAVYAEYQVGLSKPNQSERRNMVSFGVGLSLQIPVDRLFNSISRFLDPPPPPPPFDPSTDEEEIDC